MLRLINRFFRGYTKGGLASQKFTLNPPNALNGSARMSINVLYCFKLHTPVQIVLISEIIHRKRLNYNAALHLEKQFPNKMFGYFRMC